MADRPGGNLRHRLLPDRRRSSSSTTGGPPPPRTRRRLPRAGRPADPPVRRWRAAPVSRRCARWPHEGRSTRAPDLRAGGDRPAVDRDSRRRAGRLSRPRARSRWSTAGGITGAAPPAADPTPGLHTDLPRLRPHQSADPARHAASLHRGSPWAAPLLNVAANATRSRSGRRRWRPGRPWPPSSSFCPHWPLVVQRRVGLRLPAGRILCAAPGLNCAGRSTGVARAPSAPVEGRSGSSPLLSRTRRCCSPPVRCPSPSCACCSP